MKVSRWKSASGDRPRTGQSQSIRGKISGPIPIPNPIDDEFPMRHPGTGIATPLPDHKEPQFQPPPVEHPAASTLSISRREISPPRNTDSVVAPSAIDSNPVVANMSANSSPQRRTNPPPVNLRHSAISAASDNTKHSQDKPQRKKSTLRGALGKLFGRKKKNGSPGSTSSQRISTFGGSSQHRSDPSALNRALTKDGEPKRSASLPITEYDRALRSHSIGPQDITAIESARNSLHADPGQLTRRRAATATSHLYSPFRTRDGEPAGLSPRPASSHARGSRSLGAEDDPNEIGRAITSDIVGLRRRSRSLNGLQDAADGRSDVRRRSDEIRYWRESYDPGFMSPISSNAPENDDTGVVSVDLPESPHVVEAPPATPPQPFTFGNMASMNVMAGMKITQAAGLELRIDNLEARMRRMEKVVTQLANTVPGFKVQVEPPPDRPAPAVPGSAPSLTYTTSTAPVNPAIYQTAPQDLPGSTRYSGSLRSKDSRMSFGEAPTYIGSVHLPPLPANRPTSNSTIRGAASLPTLPRDVPGPFTAEHYSTVLALIEAERAARQSLEAQVRSLTQRLNVMSTASTVAYRGVSTHLEPPPTAKSFGSLSAFDPDSEDDDREVTGKRGFVLEDSGVATGGGDDDDYSETFATPREDRPYGFGAFGEELREDAGDGRQRKAARTLSLSQLTVGKGSQAPPANHPVPQAVGDSF